MSLTTPTTTDPSALDDEERLGEGVARDEANFEALVKRLSDQSVTKHYDAYADIPWDDPDYALHADDPRFILDDTFPLGTTEWYRRQEPALQAKIGLFIIASNMKRGLEFENVLKRGLLSYAFYQLPNGDPRFRYVYHEVAEETHHGMMFQEFVNRSGLDPAPMPWALKRLTDHVMRLGRRFPTMFFLFVLGGEDPIDHVQRKVLRTRAELHPLNRTIMRHHVTEEARHISFARHHLKVEVPRLPRRRRMQLAVATPVLLGIMADMMLVPPPELHRRFGVPREVLREARRSPLALRNKREAVAKLRRLVVELGLVSAWTRPLWKRFGLWEGTEPAS
jgi:hypothetical protein